MGEKPLVSVITPMYNAERYIANTINSVIAQSYEVFEMIIVNDCSTDGSVNVVNKYMKLDERIKLINLEKNSGAAVARNEGIKQAKGDFIAFIDADDLWKTDKLKTHINFMISNKYYFSFTDYLEVDEEGNIQKTIKAPKTLTYKEELYYNHIGTSTVIYNQSILGKIYMPELRKRQDYAFWLKILKTGINGYGLNLPLTIYKMRSDSLSSNKIDLIKYNWAVYRESEKFGVFKSSFFLFTNIITKLLDLK